MTHLYWVALQGKAHSYRQGCYPCGFVFCDCGFNSVCPLMDEDKRLVECFLLGGTCCGKNWVFLWWARLCSVNLKSNFLLMGGAVFPPCSLALLQRDLCQLAEAPRSVVVSVLTPRQVTVDPCLHWRLLDTHRQVWLSLLWGLLLSPGSWCTQSFVVPSKSLFPQPCGSSVIKSLWPSSQIPWNSQSFCHIPRLGNLLWALELV